MIHAHLMSLHDDLSTYEELFQKEKVGHKKCDRWTNRRTDIRTDGRINGGEVIPKCRSD